MIDDDEAIMSSVEGCTRKSNKGARGAIEVEEDRKSLPAKPDIICRSPELKLEGICY